MPKRKPTNKTTSLSEERIGKRIPPLEYPPIKPFPWSWQASGLYEWRAKPPIKPVPTPIPIEPVPPPFPEPPYTGSTPGADPIPLLNLPGPGPRIPIPPWWFAREELRLDVDGLYPQLTASGTFYRGLSIKVHWIASLKLSGTNRWTGDIWYKDGDALTLPHTQVEIQAVLSWFPANRRAIVTFSGGGATNRSVTYRYKSLYFHPVEFEFDTVNGATAVTTIGTHDHPNRPSTLPDEMLTIETVYRRTGFDVKMSGANNIIPLSDAGANQRWSDAEMHDAMQVHWSRFSDKPQWSLWVLFAALHDQGTSLGGIMFDDIGPNHRQGTAIFSDSFISQPPAGDPTPNAWVARMRFWTAVHEMGHAFNLAHAWQKSHPPSWGTPWIPLTNDSEARSFMNYPYNVNGGQSAFFSDFEFRFIDEELLFVRHAPERFVQMGNADWFDHHGFQQAETWTEPSFRLEARVNRPKAIFEFLEPVCIELKLTNVSGRIQLVDKDIMAGQHEMTVILKKEDKPARKWTPFATYCTAPNTVAIEPGSSIYDTLFVSAGLNGWDLAEPGRYTIQVAIRHGDEDIVSAPLRMQIKPPRGYDEENIAQDFFSEDVGRALAFDGTRVLESAIDTLRDAVDRLPDRRVTIHARVALGTPGFRAFKELRYEEDKPKIQVQKTKPDETKKLISSVLTTKLDHTAETLGHIDFKYYSDRYSTFLYEQGDKAGAAKIQGAMHTTLATRGVLKTVLEDIKKTQKDYEK